jgi:anti-anti-sigma factor
MQERSEVGRTEVAVVGELDVASAEAFAERLRHLNLNGTKVLLDLSGVRFMDSTGLQALVTAVQNARRAGRRLDVRPDLAPQVKRLIQLTEVDQILSTP